MAIIPRIRGSKRRYLVAQHRLYEFEKIFDRYRQGKASASHVALRGRKLTATSKAKKRRKSRSPT